MSNTPASVLCLLFIFVYYKSDCFTLSHIYRMNQTGLLWYCNCMLELIVLSYCEQQFWVKSPLQATVTQFYEK